MVDLVWREYYLFQLNMKAKGFLQIRRRLGNRVISLGLISFNLFVISKPIYDFLLSNGCLLHMDSVWFYGLRFQNCKLIKLTYWFITFSINQPKILLY